jgi:2-dehydropantoate 2-reductase
MKILIVGAGVIGATFGWAAAKNRSNDVIHLLRPGRSTRFANGLSMDIFDRRRGHPRRAIENYPIRVTEQIDAADHFDLVIIPTKHYTLDQTLQQVTPALKDADYLLLTQNWLGTDAIDALIAPDHYIFGDARAGGGFCEDRLVCTVSSVDIGPVKGHPEKCVQKSTALFESADIPIHVQAEMLHYLWVQYAINAGAWPALVRTGSFKKLLNDAKNIKPTISAVNECLQVVKARGVDLAHFPATQTYMDPSWLKMQLSGIGMGLMFKYSEYQKRCSLHALADQQEVRTFYFDLLHTGQSLGVAMPAMQDYQADMLNFTQPGSAW